VDGGLGGRCVSTAIELTYTVESGKAYDTHRLIFIGKIIERADKDVDKDSEIVGVKVILCTRSREQ